jgi:hypothetical protein
MTYENYIKAQLVRFCVEEGWDGSVETPLAIAQTLKNRVDNGWGGGDWIKVIASAPDYVGSIPVERVTPESKDYVFRRILLGIDEIYHGTAEALVNDDQGQESLYYAQLHNINREWFKDNILSDPESHPMVVKVGQFNFFA